MCFLNWGKIKENFIETATMETISIAGIFTKESGISLRLPCEASPCRKRACDDLQGTNSHDHYQVGQGKGKGDDESIETVEKSAMSRYA